MKKLILVTLIAAALTGCGKAERFTASWTGYSRICVNNVSYLQFTSGASVEYTTDGTVKTCQ